MNYLRSLSWCAFVLSFVPSLASADEPSLVEWTQRRVQTVLLKPLAERRSGRFSRERPAPHETRVRVPEAALTRDVGGREFVAFVVDVRYGSKWQEDAIVGCAYRASGNLFIERDNEYFPAALLLGKQVNAVAGVCRAAPARS